jgi:hypothetical protein
MHAKKYTQNAMAISPNAPFNARKNSAISLTCFSFEVLIYFVPRFELILGTHMCPTFLVILRDPTDFEPLNGWGI